MGTSNLKIHHDRRWLLYWGQRLGFPEQHYLRRWVLQTPWFSVRLHHWISSDDSRAPHDHSWWFWTLVLWGGYTDHSPCYPDRPADMPECRVERLDHLRTGSLRFRPANYRHWVEVREPCWTLLITGPVARKFGFWLGRDRFLRANKYFFTYGHHAPRPGEAPRRRRKIAEGVS